MTAVVERLGAADAEALRAIRIEALTLHPECFAADLEEAEAMTPQQWADGLRTAAWFGARKDRALVGVAMFTRPTVKKHAHTGELNALYVRADARGGGLGGALVEAVIAHATTEVEQIMLTVHAENGQAIRLCERHGFRAVGRMPRHLRVGDRFYDGIIMMRAVSPSD